MDRIIRRLNVVVTVVSVCFFAAILVFFAVSTSRGHSPKPPQHALSPDQEIRERVIKETSLFRLRENMFNLTASSHIAGTPQGARTADYVAEQFRKAGIDDVKLVHYEVKLHFSFFKKIS